MEKVGKVGKMVKAVKTKFQGVQGGADSGASKKCRQVRGRKKI